MTNPSQPVAFRLKLYASLCPNLMAVLEPLPKSQWSVVINVLAEQGAQIKLTGPGVGSSAAMQVARMPEPGVAATGAANASKAVPELPEELLMSNSGFAL